MVLTSSRILSCEVWLILMRNTSAPASNSRRIIALSEDTGPSVARILIRRRRLMACFRAPAADQTRPGAYGPANWAGRANWAGPEGCRGRPDRPFREFPAPAALEAARQAILGALDGEFLVARAHEGLSRPFAAAIVIQRVDVIEPRDQRAAQQGF